MSLKTKKHKVSSAIRENRHGMNAKLKEKINESFSSVVPVTAIVLILSIWLIPVDTGAFVLFIIGAAMLVVGMGFFQLGAEMSMEPIGEGAGIEMSKTKRLAVVIVVCFVMGFIITVAEPDLRVMSDQAQSIPNIVLIFSIAAGVGILFALAVVRSLYKFGLNKLLIALYLLVFLLAFFVPSEFLPIAFDSGGVTTGPMTVPFIMSMGVGLVSLRSGVNASEDSFGFVALSSVGPILAVMLLGMFFRPSVTGYEETASIAVSTTREVAGAFAADLPSQALAMLSTLVPLIVSFIVLQVATKRFKQTQRIRIIIGFFYTFIGLTLFITGVNTGFLPIGSLFGQSIAISNHKWLLVPLGMLIGFFIVKAEPAVAVLNRDVENVTNGAISKKAMEMSLSIGVSISVGLSMLRILTGIHILWMLLPGYAIALTMTFFVPKIFVGVAFDSGGVASGPMTSCFLLPLSIGASAAIGGNIMRDAFGVVAMVAMTPLIAVQAMGILFGAAERRAQKASTIGQQVPPDDSEILNEKDVIELIEQASIDDNEDILEFEGTES